MRAILTYHSIDDSGSPISVSPESFRAHCTFFGSGRVAVLPPDVLLRDPEGPDAVALTFDDGFRNTAEVAWPLMEAHGIGGTVFVVSGHVGGHNDWGGQRPAGIPRLPLMNWDELGSLRAKGASLGAHTRSHRPLQRLDARTVIEELDQCTMEVQRHLGTTPGTFAYPYGAVDSISATAVRDRYSLGFTTELRALDRGDDRALVPRLDMYYFRGPGDLEAWGSARFRSRLWMRGLGRRARALLPGAAVPLGRVA